MMHVDLVAIAGMFTAVAIVLGVPLVRAFTKRIEGRATPAVSSDVSQRLERIEHAIDAMSVEVERISEGQRFTTKLLASRADGANGASPFAPGAGSAAPHGGAAAGADQFFGGRR